MGLTNHGYYPLTNWDDPPSGRGPLAVLSRVILLMEGNPADHLECMKPCKDIVG